MAIDANAMYQAGFGSKSTGRNAQVDQRNERNAAITKTVFNVLGQAAIGQIKQNYQGLQQYRNYSDSQTSLLNLKVDKMPATSGDYYVGENESLKGSITELKSLYDAAARKASFGIAKGRGKGRQDMARYMKQLTDMNAVLEIYKTHREKAQSMMGVMSGVTGGEDALSMSSGSNQWQVGNSTQQANGDLGARLRWNIETGEMEVQVGGEWAVDEKGRKVYLDKAKTGTYEEYLQMASEPIKDSSESAQQTYLAGEEGKETEALSLKEGDFDKDGNAIIGDMESPAVMSREEWTKKKIENRELRSRILYKNMKFAVEADGKMADTMRGIKADILKVSYTANAVPWERISEQYYSELQAKIGDYTDDQFKDYYFGGDAFNHSSGRMTESAPAYQRLLEEDKNEGNFKDGAFAEGYGPGSSDWESRLLALKGQSFVKGSFYRKEATDRIFKNFEKQYTNNVSAYKTDNPEKITNPEAGKLTWDTSYGSISKVRANLFVNKVKNGTKTIKDIRGHNGVTYTWDLQGDGRYMTEVIKDNKKIKIYRTQEEMLIQNEMESYYPDVFKGFSQSAAKANMPDANNDGISDFIVPIDYETYVPGDGSAEKPINVTTLKEGEEPVKGKYYKMKDGKTRQSTRSGWSDSI